LHGECGMNISNIHVSIIIFLLFVFQFYFYTVVACKRGEDSEIWHTPETWLEVDDDDGFWACYPFRNRQSCAVNCVEKNDPRGGKLWD